MATLMVVASGCSEASRPWEGKPATTVIDESQPFLPGPSTSSTVVHDPVTAEAAGLWTSCYAGFQPSGDPVRDVTRLGLLCGPANGMVAYDDAPLTGRLDPTKGPLRYQFDANKGDCFRLFAVSEPTIPDLDVVVRSSRGTNVARDLTASTWPIVGADGPMCAFGRDLFTIEVSARAGSGGFAAQLWVLPTTMKRKRPTD